MQPGDSWEDVEGADGGEYGEVEGPEAGGEGICGSQWSAEGTLMQGDALEQELEGGASPVRTGPRVGSLES